MTSPAEKLTKDGATRRRNMIFVGGSSEPGGLHVHTADVAQTCAALGHRVTILCPSVNHYEGLIHDARVAVECVPPLDEGTLYEKVVRWVRIMSGYRRPDIVFCEGKFAETQIIDLTIAAALARRTYSIAHRPWDGRWNRRLSEAQYGRLSGMLLHRSIGVSDEINTSAINEFQFPAGKMRACLNWVHPDFHPPTEQERRGARLALGIAPEVMLIGYLGRLAPEKRVDVLLRAFALVLPHVKPAIELGLTGDGWKRHALTQLAGELGIIDRVRFLGWSTSPSTMLRACDIFVLPSLVEGFPLALIEAMASGCPCIAHPMSSTTRLIEHEKSGLLVDMNDAEGLASGLTGLIERPPESRTQLGVAAAERIAKEFSRDRRLPNLLAALDIPAAALPPSGPRRLAFNRG